MRHLRNDNLNAAFGNYARAIRINPESARGYHFRGRAREMLGQAAKAKKDYAKAKELGYEAEQPPSSPRKATVAGVPVLTPLRSS